MESLASPIHIDASRCSGCGACILTCPGRALSRSPGRPHLDDLSCSGCLDCLEICPTGAISTEGIRLPPARPRSALTVKLSPRWTAL